MPLKATLNPATPVRNYASRCFFLAAVNILVCTALEENTFDEMSSVFDDGFLNDLDESFFEGFDDEHVPQLTSETEDVGRKRKWDSSFDEYDSFSMSSSDLSSEDSFYSEAESVSPAYDIERASLSPEKKRRKIIDGTPGRASQDQPTFSSWESHSDDSWDVLPAFEEVQSSPINDSWDMSPIKQQHVTMPFTLGERNPIGNVLSNGIRTTQSAKGTPTYTCRACKKDLKGHQHTPTMHFMLPKHEKCWHSIAKDMDLSSSTSKSLYPPQFMKKATKKNEYACTKCGQTGTKRKILSHVMSAKCDELREDYSRTLSRNGIE